MNRKNPRRSAIIILIALIVVAVAVWATITFGGFKQVSFTDDAIDIEIIEPAAPAPRPVPSAN